MKREVAHISMATFTSVTFEINLSKLDPLLHLSR